MKRLLLVLIGTFFSLQLSAGPFDAVKDGLDNLGASFSENFTTNDAGSFVSKNRSGFSGGSMRKRIKTTRVQLVSITPPSINAGGCSGIDIHFGSFSFINGDQIRELLSSYLQGVVGLAFTMAIEQGCPVCKSAMDDMAELANWANGINLDSCEMAQSTMDALFDDQAELCAGNDADSGGADDRTQSKSDNGSCGSGSTPQQKAEEIAEQLDCTNLSGAALKACRDKRVKALDKWGNSTVGFLVAIGFLPDYDDFGVHDFWRADFYTSTIGARINGAWQPSTLKAQDVMDTLLCGVDPIQAGNGDAFDDAMANEFQSVCGSFLVKVNTQDQEPKMFNCSDSECGTYEAMGLSDWVGNCAAQSSACPFKRQGLLRQMGSAIASMQTKARGGAQAFDQFEMYLLSNAPFPLYRLVNLTAFYPDAASSLLSKNANVLSMQYAQGMMKSLFSDVLSVRNSIPTEGVVILPPESVAETMRKRSRSFKVRATEYVSEDNEAWQMNAAITRQILGLEKSLLQSNLNNGLGGLGLGLK